jgi:hypothetical protein
MIKWALQSPEKYTSLNSLGREKIYKAAKIPGSQARFLANFRKSSFASKNLLFVKLSKPTALARGFESNHWFNMVDPSILTT